MERNQKGVTHGKKVRSNHMTPPKELSSKVETKKPRGELTGQKQ